MKDTILQVLLKDENSKKVDSASSLEDGVRKLFELCSAENSSISFEAFSATIGELSLSLLFGRGDLENDFVTVTGANQAASTGITRTGGCVSMGGGAMITHCVRNNALERC